MMARRAIILACAAGLALVMGCGYSSRPMTRGDVRTVYVPVFDNQTMRRGMEFDLTRAVVDAINQKTQLKLAEKDAADTILQGEIVEVRQREYIRTEPLKPEEERVTVYVNVTWKDRRTNQILMKRQNVQSYADFIVSRRQDATSASKDAMTLLAEKIVNLMEEAW